MAMTGANVAAERDAGVHWYRDSSRRRTIQEEAPGQRGGAKGGSKKWPEPQHRHGLFGAINAPTSRGAAVATSDPLQGRCRSSRSAGQDEAPDERGGAKGDGKCGATTGAAVSPDGRDQCHPAVPPDATSDHLRRRCCSRRTAGQEEAQDQRGCAKSDGGDAERWWAAAKVAKAAPAANKSAGRKLHSRAGGQHAASTAGAYQRCSIRPAISFSLDRVAAWSNGPSPSEPTFGTAPANATSGEFDVEAFIQGHGLRVRRRGEWKGGKKWELEWCPMNSEHTGGCAVITRASNGSLGFRCHHNSCTGIGWTELGERLEPGYRKLQVVGEASRLAADGWSPMVPFSVMPVERIPEGLLPGPVGDMARAVAAATETPIEMAVMTGLGIVAAAVAGKVQVCPSPGYVGLSRSTSQPS